MAVSLGVLVRVELGLGHDPPHDLAGLGTTGRADTVEAARHQRRGAAGQGGQPHLLAPAGA